MPIAYLDWNVVEALRRQELPALREAVLSWKTHKGNVLPFSAAHIAELERGASHSPTPISFEEQLRFVSELSGDNYLYWGCDTVEPILRLEHPVQVRGTLGQVPWAGGAMESLANLLDHEALESFRRALSLDPAELNNLNPPNVFEKPEAAVCPRLRSAAPGMPFIDLRSLIDAAMRMHPDGASFGWQHRFAAFFTLLNWIGFWPDNLREKGAVPSFYDSQHAAVAAFTDCFISMDRHLRVKCLCAYEYFGVRAKVVSVSDALDWFGKRTNEAPDPA